MLLGSILFLNLGVLPQEPNHCVIETKSKFQRPIGSPLAKRFNGCEFHVVNLHFFQVVHCKACSLDTTPKWHGLHMIGLRAQNIDKFTSLVEYTIGRITTMSCPPNNMCQLHIQV